MVKSGCGHTCSNSAKGFQGLVKKRSKPTSYTQHITCLPISSALPRSLVAIKIFPSKATHSKAIIYRSPLHLSSLLLTSALLLHQFLPLHPSFITANLSPISHTYIQCSCLPPSSNSHTMQSSSHSHTMKAPATNF